MVPEKIQEHVDTNDGVVGCARCGGDHEALDWKLFARALEHSDGEIDYAWAPCPTTGDPILLAWRSV